MSKKKQRKLISAVICVLLLIAVIAVIFGMEKLIGNNQKNESSTESVTETETKPTEEVATESTESIPVVDTESAQTDTAVTLSNPVVGNVESLDNTSQGWGMGPSRDELNRPIDALNYEEKYAGYSVDFIKNTEDKVIYLTFDEGYEYGPTPQILDTLKEKGCKAVFFVTKPYAESNPQLVQRMIDEGHIVGNHTVHHPANGMPSLSIQDQTNEIMETDDYIKQNFNYSMYLFRYPAGKFSEQSLAVVNNCNYRSVFWSFAYKDWDVENQPDPTTALQTVMEKLHPGAIYLLHAESQTNADILGNFIDQVRASGYQIGVYSDTL